MVGSGAKLLYKPLPSDVPKQRQPDIAFAQETLGWEPQIALRDGLTRTIKDFDDYLSHGD